MFAVDSVAGAACGMRCFRRNLARLACFPIFGLLIQGVGAAWAMTQMDVIGRQGSRWCRPH